MLTHLLSDEKKQLLLKTARLLFILEIPVLWDGKNENYLTGNTDIKNISFDFTGKQGNSLQILAHACGKNHDASEFREVDSDFIEKIRFLPLKNQNKSLDRMEISKEILHELCEEKKSTILFGEAFKILGLAGC